MNRIPALVLAIAGLGSVATVACSATTDVYFPTSNLENSGAPPTAADGSLTVEGCRASSDRLCEIIASERGQRVDHERCRALTAYHNMNSFCVAKARCLGRPYYDCMRGAANTDQAGQCAEAGDKRCGLWEEGATADRDPLDGWIRHTSAGGFTIMMPSEPSPQTDGLHGEYASSAPGSACGTSWSDSTTPFTDADLDSQVSNLGLSHLSTKRVIVLGKYRGVEVVGDNEKGQRVHSRAFSVGRRLYVLVIINEADAPQAAAFFDSFQLQ